jgi:sterol desaturase/sphingolipid hydroxylase (fatty acid hydroxylase superfamily)
MADIVTGFLLLSYAALVALDFFAPARAYPKLAHWRLKGLGFFVLNIGLFSTLPFLWDGWLGEHRLIDASGLGTSVGALVGLLAQQLLSYTWHRSMHRTPLLWRWFHQMHHSAERVDIFGAMYFHPLDVVGFAFVGSLALVFTLPTTAISRCGISCLALSAIPPRGTPLRASTTARHNVLAPCCSVAT